MSLAFSRVYVQRAEVKKIERNREERRGEESIMNAASLL
jgi:hypothetical protein